MQLCDLLEGATSIPEIAARLHAAVARQRDPRARTFVLRVMESARVLLPRPIRKICHDMVSFVAKRLLEINPNAELDHAVPVRSSKQLVGESDATLSQLFRDCSGRLGPTLQASTWRSASCSRLFSPWPRVPIWRHWTRSATGASPMHRFWCGTVCLLPEVDKPHGPIPFACT